MSVLAPGVYATMHVHAYVHYACASTLRKLERMEIVWAAVHAKNTAKKLLCKQDTAIVISEKSHVHKKTQLTEKWNTRTTLHRRPQAKSGLGSNYTRKFKLESRSNIQANLNKFRMRSQRYCRLYDILKMPAGRQCTLN